MHDVVWSCVEILQLNDRQPYVFDKFDESNELSPPKLSDVDHEVPNEPEQALYPTLI